MDQVSEVGQLLLSCSRLDHSGFAKCCVGRGRAAAQSKPALDECGQNRGRSNQGHIRFCSDQELFTEESSRITF